MKQFQCSSVVNIKNKKSRMKLFTAFLNDRYTEPRCELNFESPFQLITATILSAQCTDKQVNKTTPALFKKYPTAEKLAVADQADVEELIRSTGFYKNKAKNIIGMASALVLKHDGEVPDKLEELVKLPGVGRKTANVVLGNAFNIPGMVVDTHVMRTANRLGFIKSDAPEEIESALEKLVPKKEWIDFSHRVILLGRELCSARNPKCSECPFSDTETEK